MSNDNVRLAMRDKLREVFCSYPDPYVLLSEIKPLLADSKYFAAQPASTYLTITVSDTTTFRAVSNVISDLQAVLGWTTDKTASVIQKRRIHDIALSCVSTQVSYSDYISAIYSFGYFGGPQPVDYIAPRGTMIPLTTIDFFQLPTSSPKTISYPQIRALFKSYIEYSSRLTKADRLFEDLQKKVYDRLPQDQQCDIAFIKQNIIRTRPVAFATFFKQFASTVCPLNLTNTELSNPFWDTDTGMEWQATYMAPSDTITWDEVYQALISNNRPVLETLSSLKASSSPHYRSSMNTEAGATTATVTDSTTLIQGMEAAVLSTGLNTLAPGLSSMVQVVETDIKALVNSLDTIVNSPSTTTTTASASRKQQVLATVQPAPVTFGKIKKRYGHAAPTTPAKA